MTKGEITVLTKDRTPPLGTDERLVCAFDWTHERVRRDIVVTEGAGAGGLAAAVVIDVRRWRGFDFTTVTRTGRTRSIASALPVETSVLVVRT